MPDKKEVIIGFISAAAIFLTVFFSGLYLGGDPVLRQMIIFSVTAQSVAGVYPMPFSKHDAFDFAEQALFDQLDPFSYRLEKDQYNHLLEESSGEYGGIGITVAPRDTALMVVTVREGGPAYTAGMKSGDLIITVDGEKVPSADPSEAVGRIRGPSGSKISLTIYRPAVRDTVPLTLTRSKIKLEHLPYYGMADEEIAYIRIADFETGTADDLEDAVKSLEKQSPVGYIIDLRSNPGGYLNEAIEAADLFLDKGELIVGTDCRSRWDSRKYFSRSRPLTSKPVVILTDRGSASAAEIFTGALCGAGRGVAVGDTTFGKGLVQTLFGLPNGEALRLTTSRYYFADGRYLNPPDKELTFSGLAPDIVYKRQGETAFREMVFSRFLIYDFVDSHRELLSNYPDRFNYPDTVVDLFAEYVRSRGIDYQSWLTEMLYLIRVSQGLEQASEEVVRYLDEMIELSRITDRNVFYRHADLLKFYIRRVAVEQKSGRQAMYRYVLVPGQADIRLATDILSDGERYRALLVSGFDSP